jgi:uncharacterized protein
VSAPQRDTPFLPGRHPIEAYGRGGFRFAGMSHRGSLLCLPDGIRAWPVATRDDISEETLAPVLDLAERLDFVVLGYGREPWPVPERLRAPFRGRKLSFDAMTTGAAVRTYNVMVAEGRRVAAALVAVD